MSLCQQSLTELVVVLNVTLSFLVRRYYLIDDLADAVERQLAKLKDEHEPFCRVPVITSPEEEHLIVSTASKVSYAFMYGSVQWGCPGLHLVRGGSLSLSCSMGARHP